MIYMSYKSIIFIMKYRVYALIHGDILPKGKLLGCDIRKMSFAEQKRRKFAPIQSVFSKEKRYRTYATTLRYVDPLMIKSQHIAVYDIEEDKPSSALGGAVKEIDKLCRFLSIACLEDVKRKYGRDRGSLEPYLYQVVKIYEIGSKGREKEVKFKLKSGIIYLPKRPEHANWRDAGIKKFIEESSKFQDDALQRSLRYLYRSSIGGFLLDSREKIALDHIKSIEIIINDLSSKRDFKDRLDEVGSKIGLTPQEKQRIKDFWEDRSTYGDVAHVTKFDNTERYPNQFPLPSNVQYSGGAFDSVAGSVWIKYFFYKKSITVIEIEEPDSYKKSGEFIKIYRMWPERNGANLVYCTTEKNKDLLKREVIKAFVTRSGIQEKDILETIVGQGKKSITIRVKNNS